MKSLNLLKTCQIDPKYKKINIYDTELRSYLGKVEIGALATNF